MAWFFRHESCSKARIALLERIAAAEVEVQALKLAQRDLLERFLQYEGREKKRKALDAPVPENGGPDPISAKILARRQHVPLRAG